MTDLEQIAKGLTRAQKAYLTTKARHEFVWGEWRWMTYPPTNTHTILHKLGLVLAVGMITDLGMQVRNLLQKEQGR